MSRILTSSLIQCSISPQYHFYQAMWTLVGAGIKNVNQSARLMTEVLPQECVHYPQKVAEFDPDNSQVKLANGDVVRKK